MSAVVVTGGYERPEVYGPFESVEEAKQTKKALERTFANEADEDRDGLVEYGALVEAGVCPSVEIVEMKRLGG